MVSYEIIEFANQYCNNLKKVIPKENSLFGWVLHETKKNIAPFLLLIKAIGLGSLPIIFQIIIVFGIIFIPLWILFALFLVFDSQKEDSLDYSDNNETSKIKEEENMEEENMEEDCSEEKSNNQSDSKIRIMTEDKSKMSKLKSE